MPYWYVWKLVSRFDDVATPNVYLSIAKEVDTFIASALNSDALNIGHG
jgi:hypothetical protein